MISTLINGISYSRILVLSTCKVLSFSRPGAISRVFFYVLVFPTPLWHICWFVKNCFFPYDNVNTKMPQSLLIVVTEKKHTGESAWNLSNLSTTWNWKKTLLCPCKRQKISWQLNFINKNKNIKNFEFGKACHSNVVAIETLSAMFNN